MDIHAYRDNTIIITRYHWSPQALKEVERHLTAVSLERNYYRTICKTSKDNVVAEYTTDGVFQPPPPGDLSRPISAGKTVHYSFDMAQQVCSL